MLAKDNFIKDIGRLIFWYPVRWLILIMPFSATYRLGGLLGSIDFRLTGNSRIERMRKNIQAICSAEESRRHIEDNRRNHFRNVLELVKYPTLSTDLMNSYVSFSGLGLLDQELNKGRGVLLMTAHFGAKQLLQIALGLKGYKICQINYHMPKEDLSYIQKKVSQRHRIGIEEKLPVKFISATGFMRTAYKTLKNNEILIVAGDGPGIRHLMDDSYIPLSFLGRTMMFPANIAGLAKRTEAGIIPVFAVRDGAHHVIRFMPTLRQDASVESLVEAYANELEKIVREHPDQWEFWEEFDAGVLLAK